MKMISIKNVIVFIMSFFILLGCYSSYPNHNNVEEVKHIVIEIKSNETTTYDGYVSIWIEIQNDNDHLEIEKSLAKSNISFRKQDNYYWIDEASSGFFVRKVFIVKNKERIMLNNQDVTKNGNATISKDSEITPGAFYRKM